MLRAELDKDEGTTCQKHNAWMVLYGSKWTVVKEDRMIEREASE